MPSAAAMSMAARMRVLLPQTPGVVPQTPTTIGHRSFGLLGGRGKGQQGQRGQARSKAQSSYGLLCPGGKTGGSSTTKQDPAPPTKREPAPFVKRDTAPSANRGPARLAMPKVVPVVKMPENPMPPPPNNEMPEKPKQTTPPAKKEKKKKKTQHDPPRETKPPPKRKFTDIRTAFIGADDAGPDGGPLEPVKKVTPYLEDPLDYWATVGHQPQMPDNFARVKLKRNTISLLTMHLENFDQWDRENLDYRLLPDLKYKLNMGPALRAPLWRDYLAAHSPHDFATVLQNLRGLISIPGARPKMVPDVCERVDKILVRRIEHWSRGLGTVLENGATKGDAVFYNLSKEDADCIAKGEAPTIEGYHILAVLDFEGGTDWDPAAQRSRFRGRKTVPIMAHHYTPEHQCIDLLLENERRNGNPNNRKRPPTRRANVPCFRLRTMFYPNTNEVATAIREVQIVDRAVTKAAKAWQPNDDMARLRNQFIVAEKAAAVRPADREPWPVVNGPSGGDQPTRFVAMVMPKTGTHAHVMQFIMAIMRGGIWRGFGWRETHGARQAAKPESKVASESSKVVSRSSKVTSESSKVVSESSKVASESAVKNSSAIEAESSTEAPVSTPREFEQVAEETPEVQAVEIPETQAVETPETQAVETPKSEPEEDGLSAWTVIHVGKSGGQ